MRKAPALLLALAVTTNGWAAIAYVTDELVLGVYSAQSTQGPRLATLHSGASVEVLEAKGDSTRVLLPDGITGWVKSVYITTSQPASVRLKLLQEEIVRNRSSTPPLARLPQALRNPSAVAVPAAATPMTLHPWPWVAALIAALLASFWLGHATLARRIKYKFGGIKVY